MSLDGRVMVNDELSLVSLKRSSLTMKNHYFIHGNSKENLQLKLIRDFSHHFLLHLMFVLTFFYHFLVCELLIEIFYRIFVEIFIF